VTPAMNRDQLWAAIDEQRLRVVDLLNGLTDDEWKSPSLCQGWTVRDVAGHLTLQQLGWGSALATMLTYRGNIDRAILESARKRGATLSTQQLIDQIHDTVGSRRHNAGVTSLETLIDICVHGQDIAIPLGYHVEIPPATAAVALSRMWTMRFPPPFPAIRRMKGFRLTATDTDWSAGHGPEVRGPIGAILLVGCGRLVALPELSGVGAADLSAQLSGGLRTS
jgi:uncharacterized protein (TIGR03083 family)